MKSRSRTFSCLAVIAAIAICTCFVACTSRSAGKEAATAQQAANDAQVATQAAQQNVQKANDANAKAQAAVQANPTDPNLQQAATSAAAKAAAAQAAFDQSIMALSNANTALANATAKYNSAVEHDNSTWAMIAAIATPVGAAIGIPLGGLVDPFKKLAMGQQQGAAMATTAITNADTANTLQHPSIRDTISNSLAANPDVRTAVDAHL